jgi:hypothetical protein
MQGNICLDDRQPRLQLPSRAVHWSVNDSAIKLDFRISGNHRACHNHHHNYKSEFHIALTMRLDHLGVSAQIRSSDIEGKSTKVGATKAVVEHQSSNISREYPSRISVAKYGVAFDIHIRENFRSERFDGSWSAPRIQRQASLAAGLREESVPVPIMLDGNLRQ